MKTAALRSACFLPALAVTAFALPAQAQVVSAAYRGVSKSEAILGGAPSALAAITARQDGQDYLQPAAAPTYYRPAVANYVRPAVSSDRPDVFNSVALSIGRSPLDARWSQVSGAGVGGNAGAFAASLRDQDILSKLEAVNGYVNARVRFVDEPASPGTCHTLSCIFLVSLTQTPPQPRSQGSLKSDSTLHF